MWKDSESVWHIVSGCSNLAQKESRYKKRHNKAALRVHWRLGKKYDLKCGEKRYEHKPLPVIENNRVKLVRDSTIVTGRRVPHNRPGMTIVLQDQRRWLMVEVLVPDHRNIMTTEAWKIERYLKPRS